MRLSGLKSDFSVITGREIVNHLLRETGQIENQAVNPAQIIEFLKINYITFDFKVELEQKDFLHDITLRALLSFPDKIIATDEGLRDTQERFSIFHEIGHYVIPNHRASLYICNPNDFDFYGRQKLEVEANEFAADLLFMGDRFVAEANSFPLSARTVKELGDKYKASYEATARRLVERKIRPCMLVVFKKGTARVSSSSGFESPWLVHYCISSPSFRSKYFTSLKGELPTELIPQIAVSGRDIADSITQEICISSPTGQSYRFVSEYFYNQYNIFCFLSEPTS
jgi:Zn-dependent peptidase ImmA (M78 family)